MDRVKQLIEVALTTPSKSTLCEDCRRKKSAPVLKESKVSNLLSEGLRHHIDNKIPLSECEYKSGSEAHLSLIREARKLYSRGIINVSESDKALLETDLGHFGEYKGEIVPLDLPMLNERFEKETPSFDDKSSRIDFENEFDFLDFLAGLDSSIVRKGYNALMDYIKDETRYNPVSPQMLRKAKAAISHNRDPKDEIPGKGKLRFADKNPVNLLPNLKESDLDEAEYQGRKVKLNKPMAGDVKKFKVYVKNPKGNVVKVNFGDPNMRIKKSDPARRKSFRARHNCDNPGPKHKARYWSCKKW